MFIKEVTERVNLIAVLERYDIKLHGKMFSCPFHEKDSHPSAALRKNNRWTCYTCGAKGDALDFVSRMENISLLEAARQINAEFNLGVGDTKPFTREEHQKWLFAQQQKEQKKREWEAKWKRLVQLHRTYVYAIRHYAPQYPQDFENLDARYVRAVQEIDWVAYQLEELQRNPVA